MLKFACPLCGNGLFFNNFHCLACNTEVSFSPRDFNFRPTAQCCNCQNRVEHGVCNWTSDDPEQPFCQSCMTNQVVPDLSVLGNKDKWMRLEEGKRRLLFTCLRLGIPLQSVSFRFVARTLDEPATTGHCDGVITVNIGEADPVAREATKQNLNEKLRTVVGHFRHEFGHYYWTQRIEPWLADLERFRELFGDEREDYQASLDQHYSSPSQASQEHISVYASAHPWEDWAETFAHYLHMRDVLETAEEFGLAPRAVSSSFDFDHGLLEWKRLSVAFNEINRSMGLQDLYPFAISDPVAEKLRFVHQMVQQPAPPLSALAPLQVTPLSDPLSAPNPFPGAGSPEPLCAAEDLEEWQELSPEEKSEPSYDPLDDLALPEQLPPALALEPAEPQPHSGQAVLAPEFSADPLDAGASDSPSL